MAAPPASDVPVLDDRAHGEPAFLGEPRERTVPQQLDRPATDGDRRCPRCAAPLHQRSVDDLELEECYGCHGVFVDHATIERVLADRTAARARTLLSALPGTMQHKPPATSERMYLPCPICNVVMNRRLFAAHTGVIVDVCRAHGTFFDGGELPHILELVAQGRQLQPPPEADHHNDKRVLPPITLPSEAAPLPIARLYAQREPQGAVGVLIDLLSELFDTLD